MAANIIENEKIIFDRGSNLCKGELELTYSIIKYNLRFLHLIKLKVAGNNIISATNHVD